MKRLEGGAEPSPDRGGAGGRQLLAADDRGETLETGLALPQSGKAGAIEDRLQPWVLLHQRVDGVVKVGLGFQVDGHCKSFSRHARA